MKDKDGNDIKKTVKVGLPLQDLVSEIQRLSGGWPKRVEELLFAEGDKHRPLWLDTSNKLFAWISGQLPRQESNPVIWERGADLVTEGRFHAGLTQMAERFRAIELYPHHPLIPEHYYMHPRPQGGDGKALEKLLSFFCPVTVEDGELVKAFFLSLIWGGPPGQRPAWLFTSDPHDPKGGRGVGKTTLARTGSKLVGGHVDLAANEKMSDIITRLLSPTALERRVVLLDNLKALKFTWAELEALITTDTISGHAMYQGEGQRPNVLTFILTLNGASLSRDMAQRTVIVWLKRPDYRDTWEAEVEAHVEANRWAIIGDLIAVLQDKPRQRLSECTRWAAWETAVLSRVSNPAECQTLIRERQSQVDEDSEESALVREKFIQQLARRNHDPEREVVFLPSAVAALWVELATGEKKATNKQTGYLKTLTIAELKKSDRGDSRGWVWRGKQSPPLKEAVQLKDEPEPEPLST
jgi:hypothetical protein